MLQELLEFGQIVGIILFLLPIAMGCTLFVLIIRMIIRKNMNETKQRTQIIMSYIEKNPNANLEELLSKTSPKPKLLKEKQLRKLTWGILTALLGLIFLGMGAWMGYVGGSDPDDITFSAFMGCILLAVSISFIVTYFVGKKMLAKEMEAEEQELTKQA